MNKVDEIKTFIKEEAIDVAFISESHERESKRLEDHFVLENFQVISNVYQRQGKGGRPAIIVNNEKQAGAELCQAQDKLEVIVYIGLKVEFKLRCSYELRCSNDLRCSYELR